MAKSSFINKKVLGIMIFIVLAVGIGVAVFMLTRPKADLEAPYNNTYDLTINSDYKQVQQYHNIIAVHLDACNKNITEEQANTNLINKADIQLTIDMYSVIESVNASYEVLNVNFLQNFAFTQDSDGQMIKVQQAMTESYNALLEKLASCTTHINTYLLEHKITGKAYTQIYREIANYTVFYLDYMTELTNFYYLAGQIYQNYLVPSFEVNPLNKQNVQSITVWAKELVANIAIEDYNEEFCSITTLKDSALKLNLFSITKFVSGQTYFAQKAVYDELLKCFSDISGEELIKAVARQNHKVFIEGLETAEQKTSATKICTDYFGLAV